MSADNHRDRLRTHFCWAMGVYMVSFFAMIHFFRVIKDSFREGFGTIFVWSRSGIDFSYLYGIASEIRRGEVSISGYPPLTGVTFVPFTFLPEHSAYIVFTFLSVLLLFAIVFLCLRENRTFASLEMDLFIALLCTGLFYHTYPFLFIIERGQFDILPAFLMALALFALSRNYRKTAVLALVMATQYKIYPLVLGSVFIFRYGWRILIPIAGLNILMLFMRGTVVGVGCLDWLTQREHVDPMYWPGNHCLASFAHEMVRLGHLSPNQETLLAKVLTILVAFVFVSVCAWVMFQRKPQKQSILSVVEIGLIGMSFQMMSLVLGYSHDYRLIIQLTPFLLMISRNKEDFVYPKPFTYALLAVLAMSTAFLFVPFFLIKTFGVLAAFIAYVLFAISPAQRFNSMNMGPRP